MSLKERIINKSETSISRASKLWNAVFSMLNALQSVILLFFVTRFCGEEDAGIFSYAFSVAYLMIMISNYGVRNYQATDIGYHQKFRDYLIHRISTSVITIAIIFIYCFGKKYTGLKFDLVILCTVLKVIESMEDVFHGEYQRRGRLDVASKLGVIRYAISLVAFVVTYLITEDLAVSFISMCLVSFVIFLFSNLYICGIFQVGVKRSGPGEVIKLYVICFPLFLTTFFNIYICNAAKYSLEKYSTDVIQGYYGMIFMPVFVINLLCSFIYRPKLVELAEYWRDKKHDVLSSFLKKQLLMILIISIIVVAGGYLIGLKILSIFYGVDLMKYRMSFIILLIGGGMTATVDFLNNIFIVVRKQNLMVWIYGGVSLVTLFVTSILVKRYELIGASLSYTLMVMLQAVVMVVYMLFFIEKSKKSAEG